MKYNNIPINLTFNARTDMFTAEFEVLGQLDVVAGYDRRQVQLEAIDQIKRALDAKCDWCNAAATNPSGLCEDCDNEAYQHNEDLSC